MRLRNEDFEFPDLLGAAYEYLIGEFADSAGKKGGEFYTPRDVVRMMVRLVKPRPGMRVYDPCVGLGRHAHPVQGVRRGARPATRVTWPWPGRRNGSIWADLQDEHDPPRILDADLQNDDTLADPHLEGGELMRFDRVLTNPPFSHELLGRRT